jgi:putative DNA primase/helicase
MVEDIAVRMQVPIDFPAVVAVATLAGVCGRRAMIQPKAVDDSWEVVPNLWGAIVAGAGMMKSPVIKAVTSPVKAVERELQAKSEGEMAKYLQAKRKWILDQAIEDAKYKRSRKSKSANDDENPPSLPDPGTEPKAPSQARILTTDATFESLHKLLEQNHAGIFVLRDELTGWLTSLEKVGRESERSFYLECWNGDSNFTIDRIGRGSIYVDNCCVSLFGGIQPSRLHSYFADAMVNGESSDGLIQRFQLLIWPDQPKKWSYEDRKKDVEAFKNAEEVYRRIAALNPENPLHLMFSPEAQCFFQKWLTEWMNIELANEELDQSLLAHFSKYRSLMPSLALLFSLADGNLDTVGVEHSKQAADWCTYLKGHAERIYSVQADPYLSAARALKRRLEKGLLGDQEGNFTIRDVYRSGWAGLSTPERARGALRKLEEYNWVRSTDGRSRMERAGHINGGRPSEIYIIHPKILERIKHSGTKPSIRETQTLGSAPIEN